MSAREPLGPEEQALAGRLRDWSVAPPPAALDQRILAQARAAVAGPGRRPRPLLLGLASAATLVLAVGVVWRVLEPLPADLAPSPEAVPQMRGADRDAAAITGSGSEQRAPDATRPGPGPVQQAPARPPGALARQPSVGARESALPERTFEAPPPAAPPAPLAPPAPPAPIAEPAAEPAPAETATGGEPADRSARRRGPAAADREQARAREERQGSEALPESPTAAIERIRALIAAGQMAQARDEVDRLRRRAPDLVLPPDLLELAAEAAH